VQHHEQALTRCVCAAAAQVELWLGVQSLWMYMEAVFSGGDIVKQLPAEAKRFQNIDKSFMKARRGRLPHACACMPCLQAPAAADASAPMTPCLWGSCIVTLSASAAAVCAAIVLGVFQHCTCMTGHQLQACMKADCACMCAQVVAHAGEVRGVVAVCTGSDALRTTLPTLLEQLELCQKSLAAYLEAKRAEFPRFYFVSDPTLLEILSLGSDPPSVVPHFQSGLFDSLSNVTFDKVPCLGKSCLSWLAQPILGLHIPYETCSTLWHMYAWNWSLLSSVNVSCTLLRKFL
jgi:hypothetical protein